MQWTNKHVSGNVVEGDVFILTAATQAMRRFVNSDNVTWDPRCCFQTGKLKN